MSNCIKPIMQGDQYSIPFVIKDQLTKLPIDIDDIVKIEFTIGSLKKYYSQESSEVAYDEDSHCFLFPLSQEETLSLEGSQLVQVRVKMMDGTVVGRVYGSILIQYSESEEVL